MHRELHSEAVRCADGEVRQIIPFIGSVVYRSSGHLTYVEALDASDSGGGHRFEVGLDSGFGDVTVHPMPPGVWLGRYRWILEIRLQIRSALTCSGKKPESDHGNEKLSHIGVLFFVCIPNGWGALSRYKYRRYYSLRNNAVFRINTKIFKCEVPA